MRRVVTIVLFCSTGIIVGAVAAADEKPKVVCESDASGANMVCRDVWLGEDATPFRRVAPASPAPVGAAPKPSLPILAPPPAREPSAAQAPAYLRKSDASPRVEPARPATSAPAIAGRTPPNVAPKPPAEPVKPITRPLPPPPDVVAETTTMPAPAATSTETSANAIAATPPASVAKKPVAAAAAISPVPEPKPPIAPAVEPVAAAPQPAPVATAEPPATSLATTRSPAVAESAPSSSLASAASVALLGGAEFRALDGSHYTLELANAKSPDSLRDLAARLQLGGAVYLVHLHSPESDRWLLTWADHASQSEARSARQQVPADAAINSGWPRRIAPLQNELASP